MTKRSDVLTHLTCDELLAVVEPATELCRPAVWVWSPSLNFGTAGADWISSPLATD